jgi:cysteine desulfurase / selenocysteine lyase
MSASHNFNFMDMMHEGRRSFDVHRIRQQFPLLNRQIHGKPLIYLDNAATSQKPQVVIDAIQRYYTHDNSNIHRGVHLLSERATTAYECSRSRIRRFLNASSNREIVFTRGTTESINLVSQSFGRSRLKAGDQVLISAMEHHSNIVPWQMVCEQTGAQLRIIPMNDQGELLLDEYQKLLNKRTRIVALVHISNALGTVNPVREMTAMARQWGARVLLDGAQAVPHMAVDVADLDCDFYAFSGHKLFGPTGVGVLYGKEDLLESMPPYQGGGDMISSVSFEKTTYNELPYKFEAGTPNIEGGIALAVAIDYVHEIGLEAIAAYESELLEYATMAFSGLDGTHLIGTAQNKASILSFVMDNAHPHDIGTILDHEGIAIRTGHHCAQPVMKFFGVPATARASLAFYNTTEEIDALIKALEKVREVLH